MKMPRPLIIKIEDSNNHFYQPMKSRIVTNLSKVSSRSLPKIDSVSNDDMAEIKNHVRSLISRYEDPNFTNPSLVKTKSLPNIGPAKPLRITTAEINLDNKKVTKASERPEKEKFDFQTVWRKFERTSSEVQKSKVVKKTQHHVGDLEYIKERAYVLLQDYDRLRESAWKKEVLLFLKNVCSVSDNAMTHTNENHTTETRKEVKNEEYQHKVKGMANIFDRQISATLSTPTPDKYHQYFTGNAMNSHHNGDEKVEIESLSDESSLSDSENSQGAYNFQQNLSPVMKITELKSYFESKQDKTEKTETVESTEEVIFVDSEEEEPKPKEPQEIIEELIKQIEHLKNGIENISKEDNDKGSQINEELIQILIQLDDVFSHNDTVRTERKKAIAFVQTCIRMLREKMRS